MYQRFDSIQVNFGQFYSVSKKPLKIIKSVLTYVKRIGTKTTQNPIFLVYNWFFFQNYHRRLTQRISRHKRFLSFSLFLALSFATGVI